MFLAICAVGLAAAQTPEVLRSGYTHTTGNIITDSVGQNVGFCTKPLGSSMQIPGAMDAFYAGQYDLVVERCSDIGLERMGALVAQAITSKQMSGEGALDESALQDALGNAESALLNNPDSVDARLQKAIALSLLARQMSVREARKSGYVDDARDLVERILEDHPDHVHANGFMAVWNIEVRRRGGRFGALIMGASLKEAKVHYQRAVTADPDDASLHWQYARALALLDAEDYEEEIKGALEAALICRDDTALEAVMRGRARSLLIEMESGDYDAAEALAERLL